MSKSPSKGKPPDAPAEDSLDFTAAKPARPAAKPPAAAAARRKKQPPASDKPGGSRKTFVMLLGAIAVAALVAFALKDDPPKETEPSKSMSAKGAAPPEQAPTLPKAQPYPPPVQTAPRPGSAPAEPSKLESVRAMPPEFLKAVQEYNTKPAYKAIALALDSDGKWAYGSISGAGTQPGANDAALAECARFALKSSARSACKLFAAGDKVVW